MTTISTPSLVAPSGDPEALWNLGVRGIPLTQYLRWAEEAGVFSLMADADVVSLDDIVAHSALNRRGAEAVVRLLRAWHIADRAGDGYRLTTVGRDFLDRRKPYYIGTALYGMLRAPLPPQLRKGQHIRRYSEYTGTLLDRLRFLRKPNHFGRREQLVMQHCRNLPIAVAAVRTGYFAGIRHLADIGGGSGAFAVPLALEYPDLRITLVELPRALKYVPPFLDRHGVTSRVSLSGHNVHSRPWPLNECDAVLLGNFLHFCDDDESLDVMRESHRVLPRDGRIFIHEMLWDDDAGGPPLTALWNFWMTTMSSGRQRTADEFERLLHTAGFDRPLVMRTTGGFSLIVATKG